jgi:hypothetical protein
VEVSQLESGFNICILARFISNLILLQHKEGSAVEHEVVDAVEVLVAPSELLEYQVSFLIELRPFSYIILP